VTNIFFCAMTFSAAFLFASVCHAKGDQRDSPQAGARTYAQNYKDMVLTTCLANAYKDDPLAAVDAGSSVSALRDWTSYDMERAPDAVKALVDDYLTRDYHNPLVESEIKGVRFDLLKCLDLYHSTDLEVQMKQMVFDPERTYRQDATSPLNSK